MAQQSALNAYPVGTGGHGAQWRRGDLLVHFAGSKLGIFAARVEAGFEGHIPACRQGSEASVWAQPP